jgi:hypothetical protein
MKVFIESEGSAIDNDANLTSHWQPDKITGKLL